MLKIELQKHDDLDKNRPFLLNEKTNTKIKKYVKTDSNKLNEASFNLTKNAMEEVNKK